MLIFRRISTFGERGYNNKKYLHSTFYNPPTSDLQTWRNIEHSIDLALNCNYDIILMIPNLFEQWSTYICEKYT
jgi:hypothetical protein